MGNFVDIFQFHKIFSASTDICLLNVGYDDFTLPRLQSASASMGERMQNFYTIHFVLSGKGILRICGNEYHISAGEMFFIPPNEIMRYKPELDDPWEYVWVALKLDAGKNYEALLGFDNGRFVKQIPQYRRVRGILKRMLDGLLNDGAGHFFAMACFYEIVDVCTRKSYTAGIEGVKELIDGTCTMQEFSVEQLCHDVGISHAHLLRLFKAAYGTTVKAYVLKRRISIAADLLTTTELSVRSVAYSSGFNDELHFMKAFKKEMGVTALNYKRNNKKTDKTDIKSVDL